MADALVGFYGHHVAERIAAAIKHVLPAFDDGAFLVSARRGYNALNLMQRGRHIAQALHAHLAHPYCKAIPVLLRSFDHIAPEPEPSSLASFVYLPFSYFISEFGLEDFDLSMQAQYALTQRFTAEFCVRPFLLQHTNATLKQFHEWIDDDSEHVRRWISEGTRPRLPWGIRLKPFVDDPAPVLALLEKLKDDPSEYVRRSVANNLNDIGKDNAELLLATAERWQHNASAERQKLIKHGLRSLIKAGDRRALAIIDINHDARFDVDAVKLSPKRIHLGDCVTLSATLHNPTRRPQRALVDYRIHFVRANGDHSIKVFKLKTLTLAAGDRVSLTKAHRLQQMSTRTLYHGVHKIDLLVNGNVYVVGEFSLLV